ncbi:hypothetical protein [Sutterella wadsworthensis]|uniref:hypothetical protein n=1 Tax=Sutterella wadsworthensis TaxID=40545 RepID=UPI00307E6A95
MYTSDHVDLSVCPRYQSTAIDLGSVHLLDLFLFSLNEGTIQVHDEPFIERSRPATRQINALGNITAHFSVSVLKMHTTDNRGIRPPKDNFTIGCTNKELFRLTLRVFRSIFPKGVITPQNQIPSEKNQATRARCVDYSGLKGFLRLD